MIKPFKYAIIGLVVVGVLAGALITISHIHKKPDAKQQTETSESDKSILNLKKEDVDYISFHNSRGDFKVVVKSDESSYLDGMDVPSSSSALDTLISNATSITSTSEIGTNLADLSPYGLDKPDATFEVVTKKGDKHAFSLGIETPFKDGYYLLDKSTGKVHTINTSAERLAGVCYEEYVKTDLTQELTEDNYSKINLMRVTNGAEKYPVIELKTDNKKTAEKSNEDNQIETSQYVITQPAGSLEVNSDYVSLYMQPSLAHITAEKVVKIHPTATEKASLGLDKPYYALYYEIEGKGYGFKFSKPSENGEMNMMMDGIDVVYTVNKTNFTILDTTLMGVQSRVLYLEYIDKIGSLTVSDSTGTVTFQLSGSTQKDAKEPLKATLNGKDVDTDSFKSLYMNAMSLYIEGELTSEDKPLKDVATITFTYRDSTSPVVLQYKELDARRLAVSRDGNMRYYTLTKYIQQFLDNAHKLEKGEKVEFK
ncbi:MAG: DUF4340 domain-containing protein [Bacillota bacterium]|nr:DUF4340 domain-containing protein [Bacillota bacterium]